MLWAAELTYVSFTVRADEFQGIPPQPYFAGVKCALEALAKLGAPITAPDAQQLGALIRQNDSAAVTAAEMILDRYTLARIQIESDGYARASVGGAQRALVEQGWRLFLVRVANPIGSTAKLASVLGSVRAGQELILDHSPRLPHRHPEPALTTPSIWRR